jgi:hypothetical protein
MPFDFKQNPEDKNLALIAGIMLLMWWVDAIVKLFYGKIIGLFWFCSISMLIAAFFVVYKKSDMLLAFLSASIILQGIWLIDALALAFFQMDIFGTSYYMFLPHFHIPETFTTMKHFFLIPLELFAFIHMKNLPSLIKTIKYISLFTIIFLISSLLLGPIKNINYVYKPVFGLGFFSSNGFIIYFMAYFAFLIIASSLIAAMICLVFKKYSGLFKIKNLKSYFWTGLILCFILALKVSLYVLRFQIRLF